MTQPVAAPQWEWRTFDPPAAAITRVLELAHRIATAHETSFVRYSSDVDVRVGDNGLEVQLSQRIDEHGLVQWVPVMQVDFPLSAEVVRQLFAAWNRRAPADLLPYYDEATFRASFGSDPDIRAIDITRKRWLKVANGCRIELAELSVRGERIRTLAVSSENREVVWATVKDLGLAGAVPMSYVGALRRNALALSA